MATARKRNAKGQFAKKGSKPASKAKKSSSKKAAPKKAAAAKKSGSVLANISFGGEKFACKGKMVKTKGRTKRPAVYCAVKA